MMGRAEIGTQAAIPLKPIILEQRVSGSIQKSHDKFSFTNLIHLSTLLLLTKFNGILIP